MLRNIGRDILILLGIAILALSTSGRFVEWAHEQRIENENWWGVHKAVDGDLVEMAYLDKVKRFHSPRDYKFTKHPADTGKVDLCLWGDSYVWKIPDTAYAAVDKFKFGWRYRDDLYYSLDSQRRNILIIEVAERYIRSYFSGTDIFAHVRRQQESAAVGHISRLTYAAIELPEMEWLFNKNINQNLEFNLFNYNFINPVRHWKASMNYYLFERASGDVVISPDGKQLFLKETVEGKRQENSYDPVSDEEINIIVNNLNTIHEHYRKEGFDEVYLSLIPNPATILQPEGYNQLIPRIEQNQALKIKLISIYALYKAEKRRIYRPGDTHWNNTGLQIWLQEVNKVLLHENATPPNP